MLRALLGSDRARAVPTALALLVLAFGLWQFGGAFYIAAKAGVAQVLLERAFAKSLKTGRLEKPWSWADTWPVAKMTFPAHNEEVIVLDKTSGQALAFGPGLLPGMSGLGEPGVSVIAAHNDTHFAFLETVALGERFSIQTRDGETLGFEIIGLEVVDTGDPLSLLSPGRPYLILSTCFPFGMTPNQTPYRYLVTARLAEN